MSPYRHLRRFVWIGIAAAVACGPRTMKVTGHAMEPTLADGSDATLTSDVQPIHRGDIVMFHSPKDPSQTLLLRVVGLPNESLALVAGHLVIDGSEVPEPYVPYNERSLEMTTPLKIPVNRLYVMGDNRMNSSDSRQWGTIAADTVLAKVVLK